MTLPRSSISPRPLLRALCLCSVLFFAAKGTGQVQRWRILGLEEGLPQVQVYDISQDPGGWIWIGTHGGAARYDGDEFRTFSQRDGLKSNHVTSILPLGEGEVFLGHAYSSTFTHIEKDSAHPVEGLPKSYDGEASDLIRLGEKKIMAATDEGLIGFEETESSWKSFHIDSGRGLRSSHVSQLIKPDSGTVWALHENGIDRLDPEASFSSMELERVSLPEGGAPLEVRRGKSGRIHALFPDSLLSYENVEAFLEHDPRTEHDLPKGVDPEGFLIKKEEEFWVRTSDEGVYRLLPERSFHYGEREGLPNSTINCLHLSHAGNVWLGTGHGVAFSSDMAFQFIDERNGLVNESVFAIERGTEKDLWVGTEEGLDRLIFRSEKVQNIGKSEHYGKEELGFEFVSALYKDIAGRIWVGCHEDTGRIAVLDGKTGEVLYRWELGAKENVKAIERDRNGTIWIAGTSQGLWTCSWDEGAERIQAPEPVPEDSSRIPRTVWDLHLDARERMWVASNDRGSGYYDGEKFHPLPPDSGFPHPRPSSITEDAEGNIWFGSIGGGVIRQKGDTFKSITIEDGLAANNPFFVQADRNGSVWVGTSSGLDRVDTEDGSITSFGREKGFSGMETNQNAREMGFHGVLWFGTIKGVIRCKPSRIQKDSIPPKLHLQRIELTDETLDPEKEGRRLAYHRNHISFHYIGVHPDDRGKILYKYRLKGLEKKWSPLVEKENITFNHLPPGEYEFLVKARNSDGHWTTEPLRHRFFITPPFWRTDWFYASSGILAVLLVLFIMRARTRSLLKQQKRLEQEVANRTQELEREKERIERINQVLEEKKSEAEHQKELVETKNKEITDSLRYAKRIQKALLKEEKRVSEHLPPHFVLFKPREHVSGDFYWALEKEGHLYVTVADCTGHGVPGAFMSMLGTAFLNEICAPEGAKAPATVLQELRSKVVKELTQTEEEDHLKDGMDISMLRINLRSREVAWAGANNPLMRVIPADKDEGRGKYCSHDGKRVMVEYRADRKPIGLSDDDTSFSEQRFIPYEGEILYLFSDGFPDQFGGERGKKYKSKNFKQLLLEVSAKSMDQQREALDEEFERWRGDQEQIDDVCVLGIAPGMEENKEK